MRVTGYLVLSVLFVAGRRGGARASRVCFSSSRRHNATVKSPAHLKFGVENYKIAAVPDGTVETARPASVIFTSASTCPAWPTARRS